MSERDIVERLLELAVVECELACECDCPPEATANYRYAKTCEQAADEIARLRAEVERLGRDYQTARDAHDNLVIDNEKLRDEVRVWVAHTKKAVWSDSEECKFLNGEVTRLVKSRNRWAQKYNDLLNKKRTKDGYDVYAAAREEYRKKIAEQGIEVERLRAALKQIAGIDAWDDNEQGYVDKARAALGDTHEGSEGAGGEGYM